MVKKNMLSRKQVRILEDWISKQEIKLWFQTVPFRKAIAERASRDLGFTVSEGNLKSAAEAMDVTLPNAKGRNQTTKKFSQFQKSVLVILGDIYTKMGEKPHQELAMLIVLCQEREAVNKSN